MHIFPIQKHLILLVLVTTLLSACGPQNTQRETPSEVIPETMVSYEELGR